MRAVRSKEDVLRRRISQRASTTKLLCASLFECLHLCCTLLGRSSCALVLHHPKARHAYFPSAQIPELCAKDVHQCHSDRSSASPA
ncbi:unnamed protein product [Chondrus crispus]|uniref:Uncharacterized protein n=1 Tax=Chondrus crispus TaxID=2769 RepID=R7QFE5_CHOCR|nr:unnamed protein product [Chondrus crispus]CDF36809.1 unnamed protein product [Chondrus crispus]|eukprot:XP_005716628.1 unnamed protein product [Chondrus crispus]